MLHTPTRGDHVPAPTRALDFYLDSLYAQRPPCRQDGGRGDVRRLIPLELVVLLAQVGEEINVLVHVRHHLPRTRTDQSTHGHNRK